MLIKWSKPFLSLAVMGLLAWCLPSAYVDQWNLFNIKKISTMIFALAFIQILGSFLNRTLGSRTGAILTGFFGGLVSSTATTASLAKKSKVTSSASSSNEILIFLSATFAMLIEGAILVWSGTQSLHFSTLIVFVGPLVLTSILIGVYTQKVNAKILQNEDVSFQILPILKLSIFIISIILLSKLLQNVFGQNGLMVLTFFVSLFEIHGSVIANVQLHENGVVPTTLLNSLLVISITSSYVSKLFLISTLGNKHLKSQAFKCSVFLFLSLCMSWLASISFSSL